MAKPKFSVDQWLTDYLIPANAASNKPVLDAVIVRPGDKLLVRVNTNNTLDDVAKWRARLKELLPGVEAVFVAADQLLVYRPDGGDDRG